MTVTPAKPQSPARYSWPEIWTAVLTRPSVETFTEILNDPAASRRRAYTWMIATWIVNIIFIVLLTTRDPAAFMAALPPDVKMTADEAQSLLLTSSLCSLPIALALGIAAFAFMVWLVQFVARRVGADTKNESGTQVAYTFASIQAPLNIVSLLFAALPANIIITIISLIATLYQFYLMTLAVRAVYNLTPGRASLTVFFTFLGFFALMLGLVMLMTSMI